jgi:hypothetical protein
VSAKISPAIVTSQRAPVMVSRLGLRMLPPVKVKRTR